MATSSRPWGALGTTGEVTDNVRNRVEKVHCATTSLVGRSYAAYGASRLNASVDMGILEPYFAAGLQIYQETVEKQLGW